MNRIILVFILVILMFRFTLAQEIDLAVIDSAYIAAIKSGDSNSLYEFIRNYQDRLVSVLAACRLIHREIQNQYSLETIIEALKVRGINVVAKKEFINATNIYFPSFNLRTCIIDDYNHHLLSNPLVDLWNESQTKYINISFDALHILACMNHFKLIADGIIYYAADSVSISVIKSLGLHGIFKDFSTKMGYKSPSEAVKKLLKKEVYLEDKLAFFVYDYDAIREKYRLYELIGAGRYSGVFYVDSQEQNRKAIIREFVTELSHIFFNGNRFTIIKTDKNWIDYGFALWSQFCYAELGILLPDSKTNLHTELIDFIKSIRATAKSIFMQKKVNHISLKEINNQWNDSKGGTEESHLLALSLVSFIAEKYGPDKLTEIIKRISHDNPDRAEILVRSVIKWDYRDVERNWNKWVIETRDPLIENIENPGDL